MDREEIITRIKEAGQCVIDNAESIVGTENHLQKITITIDVDSLDKVPVVTVNKDIIPDGYLYRITEPA